MADTALLIIDMQVGNFSESNRALYEALDLIRDRWEYSGLLTVEPEGKRDKSLFSSFVKAMQSLRT